MSVIKNQHYQLDGDFLKSTTLSKAVKSYDGIIPEEIVTKEWEKLHPKSKKKTSEETDD
jgi:hypothetical protein